MATGMESIRPVCFPAWVHRYFGHDADRSLDELVVQRRPLPAVVVSVGASVGGRERECGRLALSGPLHGA